MKVAFLARAPWMVEISRRVFSDSVIGTYTHYIAWVGKTIATIWK